jgi:uncharacterized membrane protein
MHALKIPAYLKALLLFTVANLIILVIRNRIVGDATFNFLKSNLWSGVVPFIIAVVMQFVSYRLNNFFFFIGSFLWLLFYPNAPYMISDLIHSYQEPNDPNETLIVYDTLIIFSLAMLSVFYGFVSLKIMFALFHERFGHVFAHVATVISLVLSCIGFYMGRELKSEIAMGNGYLYSSEIFTEPLYILKTVWHSLMPIKDHLPAYYMMGLFGFAQYQLLFMMKDVSDLESAKLVTKDKISRINNQTITK